MPPELTASLLLAELVRLAVRVLIILVLWWVLQRVTRLALARVQAWLLRRVDYARETSFEAQKRVETLVRLLRQSANVFLFVTLTLALLMQLGIQVGPILASAGIVGVAIGFGAQSLVRDILTGFFFVLENQVRVGDVVQINGTGGLVEAMTLRTLVLRDLSGVVHVFPNGNVNTLANMTRDWSGYVFDIGIAYKEDPDRAIALLKQVAAELRRDPQFGPKIIEDAEVFGVEKLDESAVIIRGRLKTRPILQWEVGREFLRRVKKAFDRENIEIPFSHRTLHLEPPLTAALLTRLSATDRAAGPLEQKR
ncbi:MAG: mechanosensitive ion channel family protein [Nevskiales bacterium]|nr:mechanosensitive ion channel family protein [Nevskiales bacterium]